MTRWPMGMAVNHLAHPVDPHDLNHRVAAYVHNILGLVAVGLLAHAAQLASEGAAVFKAVTEGLGLLFRVSGHGSKGLVFGIGRAQAVSVQE